MDLLNEARVQLESVVSEDLLKDYIAILRQWFLFNSSTNRDEFDRQARKLLLNDEQIIAHNRFLRALLEKTSSETTSRTVTSSLPVDNSDNSKNGKPSKSRKISHFQPVDFNEYVLPLSPKNLHLGDASNKFAANELFMPDYSFMSTRIALVAWENGLQGADANITDLMVHCCQNFVRNILTAMITRKKGYKIIDGKFQYGFNQPIPDPFSRNYSNIVDHQDIVQINDTEDDSCLSKPRPSLERVEFQSVFAYSSTNKHASDNLLTVKLLYDTLRDNPKLLGNDSACQLHLMKLNLQLLSDI